MTETMLHHKSDMVDALKGCHAELVQELFTPFPLVQAGKNLEDAPDLRDQFKSAVAFYRNRQFAHALQIFLQIGQIADSHRPEAGRTAGLNAAACAVADGQNELAVFLLEPRFTSGKLFGLPLWNYSLALFRSGKIQEAIIALNVWLEKAPKGSFQGRGFLVAAALCLIVGQEEAASKNLEHALSVDQQMVLQKLGLLPNAAAILGTPEISLSQLTEKDRQTLLRLMQPRRPERIPALSTFLTDEEMRRFDGALERLAEGDYPPAVIELETLCETHPKAGYLGTALAACLLFARRDEEAKALLVSAPTVGTRPSGTTLWNLACAQIRTGQLTSALQTLLACSHTEYRSSTSVWAAIGILDGQSSRRENSEKTVEPLSWESSLERLPFPLDQRRRVLLGSLLRPKKQPRSYRPDLNRLPEQERRPLDRALDATRAVGPEQALSILEPLIQQHQAIYALKVHAASHHLLIGGERGVSDGLRLLREAERLRSLDAVSRTNLAYACFKKNDLVAVVEALEGGQSSTLADKYTFWMALSISRALLGRSDAGDAAARALDLASHGPAARTVAHALAVVEIQPTPLTIKSDPMVASIEEALERIDGNDPEGAARCLASAWGLSPQRIPEIGQSVLEPKFVRKPKSSWEPETLAIFNDAVAKFDKGNYDEAANQFERALKAYRALGFAINAIAACIKIGEPRRAIRLRGAVGRIPARPSRPYGWRIANEFVYNLALAYMSASQYGAAIKLVQRHSTKHKKDTPGLLAGLLVAICSAAPGSSDSISVMVTALENLRQTADPPSEELVIALAWAKLKQAPADVQGARQVLDSVARGKGRQTLRPAAEVASARQVREAYDYFISQRSNEETVSYLQAVIANKTSERQGGTLGAEEALRAVGVELSARLCLVEAFYLGMTAEGVVQTLEDTEDLLREYGDTIPGGFRAKNWLEVSRSAERVGLKWAALRYCQEGLKADPDRVELRDLIASIHESLEPAVIERYFSVSRRLGDITRNNVVRPDKIANLIAEEINRSSESLSGTGGLGRLLGELIAAAEDSGSVPVDIENLAERVGVEASMYLPYEAAQEIKEVIGWIVRQWGSDTARLPLDVGIYDDTVWPRADEREGCCLLSLSSLGGQIVKNVSLQDSATGSLVWQGSLEAGDVHWQRWIVEREDGFVPDDSVDIQLELSLGIVAPKKKLPLAIPVTVAAREPRWPSYPTGALTPGDVQELYGRTDVLRHLVAELGPSRAQRTYFLEAPRQMGKTSILRFVEKRVPEHVVAVYVNLEKGWSDQDAPNLWGFLIDRVIEAIGWRDRFDSGHLERKCRASDLVHLVNRVCEELGKRYILLLLDEFRMIVERSLDPRAVLAELRDFHDNPKNRISLLLADRFNRDELRLKCQHDIWAQLRSMRVGPLGRDAVAEALSTPTIGNEESDVIFLPETINRLHEVMGGYPYHIVRAAQAIVDHMWSGPWLVALPGDVDQVAGHMLEDDELFQIGLCQPERIDDLLENSVAALLEWGDLVELIDKLKDDAEWQGSLAGWQPRPEEFLIGLGEPDSIVQRLVSVGVMNPDRSGHFFSPLLNLWLRRMRNQGRSLQSGKVRRDWGIMSFGDGSRLSGEEWQSLDAALIEKCRSCRIMPPLKERVYPIEVWRHLDREVSDESTFRGFVDTYFRLFIDGREDKVGLRECPRLSLTYHSLRLVRNYHVHSGVGKTRNSMDAWDQICTRALRRHCRSYQPERPEEWHQVKAEILKSLHTGMCNAIALIGGREKDMA
jgi:tetratricopeptide (TPR) repeat protein